MAGVTVYLEDSELDVQITETLHKFVLEEELLSVDILDFGSSVVLDNEALKVELAEEVLNVDIVEDVLSVELTEVVIYGAPVNSDDFVTKTELASNTGNLIINAGYF